MSRRHKEQETESNYKPQQAESRADGSHERDNSFLDKILNFTITKRDGTKDRFSLDKIVSAVANAFKKASVSDEIEVDDKYLKIPLQYVDENIIKEVQKKSKGGRNPVKRLFSRISDSKVVEYFHNTLCAVKEKCIELYESITQYSTCFLKAANQFFSPEDDPYGKISHYHRILECEVVELPTRKTLNNWLRWFEDWSPAVTYEDRKEKKQCARHRLWERLIDWIKKYLMELAPEYAVAY